MGDPTDIIGIFIPIIMVSGGVVIALRAMRNRAIQTELEHKERLLAIEKGVALPPPTPPRQTRHRNPYLWGFIFIAFGLAMMFGMLMEADEDWGWGALFILPGIAMLLAHRLHIREERRHNGGMEQNTTYKQV